MNNFNKIRKILTSKLFKTRKHGAVNLDFMNTFLSLLSVWAGVAVCISDESTLNTWSPNFAASASTIAFFPTPLLPCIKNAGFSDNLSTIFRN